MDNRQGDKLLEAYQFETSVEDGDQGFVVVR